MMGDPILVCTCGRRLKALGVAPGKAGRCPSCGAMVRVPVPDLDPTPTAEPVEEDEWNWEGSYDLKAAQPASPPLPDPNEWPRDDIEPVADPDPGPPPTAEPVEEDEWNWEGSYDLDADHRKPPAVAEPDNFPPDDDEPAAIEPVANPAEDDEWTWTGTGYGLGADAKPPPATPVVTSDAESPDVPVPNPIPTPSRPKPKPKPEPEPWWPPRLLYPLRGAEGVAMAAVLGLAAWVMGTLIPEYCLGIVADGEKLGTPSMGHLIALISAIPIMILIPPTLIYWMQYLARVMVASGDGELRPPRPPDRNFDGLLGGLGTWIVWLIAGAGVGLLPLSVYATAGGSNPAIAIGLGLLGLPYALMALMMVFLRDDPGIWPTSVLGMMARLSPTFLGLCLTVALILCLPIGAFAAAFALRSGPFYLYVVACLPCWLITAWTSIVAMHTLGSYYAARAERLKWRHERPRWGAS